MVQQVTIFVGIGLVLHTNTVTNLVNESIYFDMTVQVLAALTLCRPVDISFPCPQRMQLTALHTKEL